VVPKKKCIINFSNPRPCRSPDLIHISLIDKIDKTVREGKSSRVNSAAAFGSYGWSGEAVKQLTQALGECGFNVVNDGIRSLWVPDEDALAACEEYGRQAAALL